MPGPRILIEEDPTPLAMEVAADLTRRLRDPDFEALTATVRGSAAVRVGAGPEAATVDIGDAAMVRHGVDGAQVVATLGSDHRWDGGEIAGAEDLPELAAWVSALASPPPGDWRRAAARLWEELGSAPGAPEALLVGDLASGEERRFGDGGRAYEIRGEPGPLLDLLEGRSALMQEASAGSIRIRGTFPEISVIDGACWRVRIDRDFPDA